MATVASVAAFLNDYLDVEGFPDHPHALNGLQVEGPETVERFAVAVDARAATIEAVAGQADLLIVHHGLFWAGLQPLVGPHWRRVRALLAADMALYSVHLPLDAHPEVGNAAVLARKLGLRSLAPFGSYRGRVIGWRGVAQARGAPDASQSGRAEGVSVDELRERLVQATGAPARSLPGGPDRVRNVGVVTGAGGSLLPQAAAEGLDVLITGEASHHHAVDATELGVTALLGGHYATETWGVREVARLLESRFGIEGRFVDVPTGM